MVANIENMKIEIVNKPKLSAFDYKRLAYGLMLLCLEDFKKPEVQAKFVEWKNNKNKRGRVYVSKK